MAGDVGGRIVGRHIYGNLYGCDAEVLRDEARLVTIVKEAVKLANAYLLSIGAYRFGPNGGLTVFAVVAESHISIHTWPEHKYATVDVYTCGDHTDPKAAFDYIVSELKPTRLEVYYGDRSMNE
ncbi:MAG: adenosylmethionine decarboxylase [Pyrobaculum sp.]